MNPQRLPALALALAVSALVWPAAAAPRQEPPFGTPAVRKLVVPEFSDQDVSALIATLDSTLAVGPPAPSSDAVRHTLGMFVKRLQAGRLTRSQEASVLDHLAALGRSNAEYLSPTEQASFMVRALTVGKRAPDATGQDLHGAAFSLSDYRGSVVVLTFTADWCAICRTQYPYYRLMQELYANWPFAILGVEAGARQSTISLKARNGLTYRSWWDSPESESGRGPIASAWNVLGWPTTYVLDADGVVRFVDLRDEDLLKAVRQLLTELAAHADEAAASRRQ